MKTLYTFIFSALIISSFNAQTGPGGIGNSSNNGLWLTAETINQNNATAVTNWTDQSGNGNDAAQTVPAEQPQYITNSSLNNQPVVRLDGNDQLIVLDDPILDGTPGITFYAVVRPYNITGAPRGILGKRITYTNPNEYAYTWFFWANNRMNLDLHTNNNRFNTGSNTFNNNTNYILRMQFDGTLAQARRARLDVNGSVITRGAENSTVLPNSNQNLVIGALNQNYGQYFEADYGDVIHFTEAVDTLEDLIVLNYLSAKYDIAIPGKDIYDMDEAANGNYDHQVIGIGRIDENFEHDNSVGNGIARIHNPSNLDFDEYLFAGHNNGQLGTWNHPDTPPVLEGRWYREWRVSETDGAGNSVDVGSIDLDFNLSSVTYNSAAEVALLIDTDNDGIFADETPITGAIDLGGSILRFANVTGIQDETRFTLGTFDFDNSPLPVTLLNFEAYQNEQAVDLIWSTQSEINNEQFIIERSKDGIHWEYLETIEGAGNSTSKIEYFTKDTKPYHGVSFYKLSQQDFDGTLTEYPPVAVKFQSNESPNIVIYPNPTSGDNINLVLENWTQDEVLIVMRDVTGRLFYSKIIFNTDEVSQQLLIELDEKLPAGNYIITASSDDTLVSKKLILK